MPRQAWTREALIIAFNLYCKLAFGQYHRRNPKVIELAGLLGRTPDAVAMKLCNFASFDPTHQRRGVSGLGHAAKADGRIWEEFNDNWDQLAVESERAYLRVKGEDPDRLTPEESTQAAEVFQVLIPPAQQETERSQLVTVRLRQSFFRQTILASYQGECCICQLPCEALLVASHIIPWAERPDLRVNPRNGLCLCALHDRAFDRGLLCVVPTFKVCMSPQLRKHLPHEAIEQMFVRYDGAPIQLPEKFKPDPAYLEHHVSQIFQSA